MLFGERRHADVCFGIVHVNLPVRLRQPESPRGATADDGCEQPYVTCTFDGLRYGEPLSSYTESGFTVVATAGPWQGGGRIGFLAQPGVPTKAEISVTAGGSTFSFVSVDLYSSTTPIPICLHRADGLDDGVLGNRHRPEHLWGDRDGCESRVGDLIDTLFIEITNPPGNNPMALDNLRLWR